MRMHERVRALVAALCLASGLPVSAAPAQAVAPPAPTAQSVGDAGTTSLVADATIQNVLAGKGQSAPASGSIGINHRSGSGRERFSAFLTVASSVDTLKAATSRSFGRALLTPGSAGASVGISSFSADYQLLTKAGSRGQRHGPRAYLGFAQTNWQLEGDSARVAEQLAVLSGGVRWVWLPINREPDPKGNSLSFAVEGGVTFRSVAGDGANDAFLQHTLGSTRRTYVGPELIATIQVFPLCRSGSGARRR